jgi:membrane dipeptidase
LALVLFACAGCTAWQPDQRAAVASPYAVFDLHVDLPYQLYFQGRPRALEQPGAEVSRAALERGRVAAVVLSLYLPSGLRPGRQQYGDLIAVLEEAEATVQTNGSLFSPHGPIRVIYGIEGCQALIGHFDRIPSLVARGVRLFGLTHQWHNDLADSSQDRSPGCGGLCPLGQRFVDVVHAAGGIIDASHASDQTVRDVVARARRAGVPVVASHSNARAVTADQRNLSDELLRAIASTGGVVGLNFHSAYLRQYQPARRHDVVRHARHMIEVMGAEHVAIGSDFDGNIQPAIGVATHADLPALASALRASGLSSAVVRAIFWENAARVFSLRSDVL